jgi:hypothetical protein
MAKVKEFQKCIVDDVDFKDTISGDHVCACPRPPALACSTAGFLAARTLRSRPLGLRPRAKYPATCQCQRVRVPCAVVEAHQSWSGPCECVKPMLYRISLDKEDIKFCTAASDKVCRSAFVSVRVARRARPRRARRQATASARQPGSTAPGGVCRPVCACLTASSSAQIAALKDHKDKVKPVFLFYKVRSVFVAARRRLVCCLPRADGGANPAACTCLALTPRCARVRRKGR